MEENRVKALANYLGIGEDEIEEIYNNEYETPDGDYLVLTEEEAYDREKEYIMNLVYDIGISSFNVNTSDFVDGDWFEEAFREIEENYVDDIEYESDEVFDNRLIQELYNEGWLEDEDFETNENGEPDFKNLKEDVDLGSAKENYVQGLMNNITDYIQEFIFQFGEDDFNRVVEENNLVDKEALAEYCIREDGVGHNIATYDGAEIDLGDGLYAYRTN